MNETNELPPPVKSKEDFARRYLKGEFGNRSPSWNSIEEYINDGGWKGLVHIRNRIGGGPTWYDVPGDEVLETFQRIVRNGEATPDKLYFSAMAPTHSTTFQGEVRRTSNQLELYYSCVALPMRASLAVGGRIVRGVVALELIRYFTDGASYDWLQHLLDSYPDHIVEFSCYSVNFGTVPGMNTVFWEVRPDRGFGSRPQKRTEFY